MAPGHRTSPEDAVRRMRLIAAAVRSGGDGSYERELCELFTYVDHHILNGGRIPRVWGGPDTRRGS